MITNNKSSSVFILTTMLDYLYRYFTMFKKNKKRPEISNPLNFEHRVHTGFDPEHGKYVGLPPQWMGIIIPDQQTEWRKPVVDPSTITDMDIQPLKVPLNINFLFSYFLKRRQNLTCMCIKGTPQNSSSLISFQDDIILLACLI